MFRKMPFLLLLIIACVLILGPFMPLYLVRGLYAISLSIKEVIVMLLPLIIFTLLFKTCISLSGSATRLIAITLALVCCSNFVSTFLSHYIGELVYDFDLSIIKPHNNVVLKPLWELALPKLIPNNIAMFGGILLGLIASKLAYKASKHVAAMLDIVVGHLLQCIMYCIPFFVAGFVCKLQYDGTVTVLIRDYTSIFTTVAIAQIAYILLLYVALSKLHIGKSITSLRNMMPAAISGFSTMSSAATMPLTIVGVERNTRNKDIARSVIPATVNVHLVGDCFAIPIFAYAILKSFGMPEPSLATYLIFALYFVIAKFSVAAIPGGGIIVMLPVLERYLGFTPDMLSLITALYILFDPVITCVNVLGNGAFAKAMDIIAKPL